MKVFSFESGYSHLITFVFLLLFSGLMSTDVKAQTDFAPGEIMFTGYRSSEPDAFSFVLLNDVLSGTTIFITDRGWNNASGFRNDNNNEGTIQLVFNNDYPCGTEIIFTDSNDANDWDNPVNQDGVIVGTVTIVAGGDPDGPELFTSGDQLFIYQSPTPTSGNQTSFVTAIQMNGQWDFFSNSDDTSSKPNGLDDSEVVEFNSEYDNAKYDCSPSEGDPSYLQAAISNDAGSGGLESDADNNWTESNAFLSLTTTCDFCCSSTLLPDLDAPCEVNVNEEFTLDVTGTLDSGASWELYTTGCGDGTPDQTTMGSSFTITAPASEGLVTYYVRSSAEMTCDDACATFEIAVGGNTNTCEECNADPLVCGDCYLPPVAVNPDLDSGCYAIKLIFVLDESGSIGADATNVRDGVLAFLNALNGQDLEIALIEFSDYGRVVNDYTPIDFLYILNIENYFNGIPYPGSGHTYSPGGGTNWHDAMIKVDDMEPSDMVMFFTDGIPTGWTDNGFVNYCGNGSTTQTPEIVNPVKLANKIKGEDTHMFMLGVGNGIDAANLELMSGPVEYDSDVNTIGSSDYSIGNFADLADDLEEFVSELCNTPLELYKEVYGAVCNGEQQFQFIVHNPGTESAATVVQVIDTFPSGYTNITYNGPPQIKLCIGPQCADQGQPQPDNAFIWTINSIPPGGYDTLTLSVEVLASGDYTNIAWAQGSNTGLVSDTVTSPNFVDDLDPTITCPTDVTIHCSDSTLPANTGIATAVDPDGSDPEVVYEDEILPGACINEYIINRSWTATDGCFNTDNCVQVILVNDTVPLIATCAATRNIVGCSTDVITGPVFSTDQVETTEAVFEDATNQGVAFDTCGISAVYYIDVESGSCPIIVSRTWTVEDVCGNTATCVQTININDEVDPDITACAVARSIEGCSTADITGPDFSTSLAASSLGEFEDATNQGAVSDDCTISTVEYIDVATGTCPTVVTRTWTISDACGNSMTCNQTITLDDTELPTLSVCAVARDIEGCSTDDITEPDFSDVSAASSEAEFENATNLGDISDGCAITSVTYIDITTGTCPIVVTRTWTVGDACGNTQTCEQTIQVDDSIVPDISSCPVTRNIEGCSTAAITGPDFSTVQAPSSLAEFEDGTNQGDVTDACGITLVEYIDVETGTCPTEITRTWTLTDACGNVSTCDQLLILDDTEAPNISSCPVTRMIEGCSTDAITGPVYSAISTASSVSEFEDATNQGSVADVCGIVTVEYIDVESGTCPIVVTRTWTITDGCGNISTCNQSIEVDDTTAPVLAVCATNRFIEGCNDGAVTDPVYSEVSTASTQAQFENATNQGSVSDGCGIASVSYIDESTGTCPIVITRTWTIEDDCGNISTCDQTIEVNDTTDPELATCPVTRFIEGCDTDALNNPEYSEVLLVSTYEEFSDANNQGDASDECSIVEVTTIDVSNGTCPIVVTRTWTVIDDCGNSSSCEQTIYIEDTLEPEISTCPVARVIEGCSTDDITNPVFSDVLSVSSETVFENATNQGVTSDECGIGEVNYIDEVTGTCPIIVTRTWTVIDLCGNSTSCTQTIEVEDTTEPDITSCAVTRVIEGCDTTALTGPAFSSVGAMSTEAEFEDGTNQGSVSDACGVVTVSYIDEASGSCPIVITRTWTIADDCGNSSTCEQTIEIDDTTSPELTCPPDVTIECTESTDPSHTGMESATDNCGASLEVTYDDVITDNPECEQAYAITRTWTATDACGNTTTCSQEITVVDSTPPDMVCPDDVTIECIDDSSPSNTGEGTATDNCDDAPVVVYTDITTATPENYGYVIERTWSATDACGNEATCVQVITVLNPLVPEILGPFFDTICSGSLVEFEAFDQGINPTSFDWDFGSGANPSAGVGVGPHEVAYTYNGTNGTEGAWIILTLGTPGCADVSDTVANVHVNEIPVAGISSPTGSPCVLEDKIFEAVEDEVPGYSYEWNFGAQANPASASTYGPHSVEYFTGGVKTVQLIISSNEEGASCSDTATLMFGVFTCPGNISGTVKKDDGSPIPSVNLRLYADQNLDGVQDNNTAIRSVFTTSTGAYSMAVITPGYYVIVQTQPAGYISLYDEDASEDFDSLSNVNTNDNIIPVTIEPSELDADNNFVEVTAPGMITGFVFEDFDNNQAPAPVEGLPGVTIELHTDNNLDGKADAGGFVESVETNSTGFYTFADVATGSYVLVELQPTDFTSVKDIDVSNDGDLVPNTNMTNDTLPVTITNGELDAGNYFIESSVCSRFVTTTMDNVPGSLRFMIDCADDGDTISFHPLLADQTLTLTAGRIEFDKSLYIISTVSPTIKIQSNVSGAFKILAGHEVEFRGLSITSGLTGFQGAAFENLGGLTLRDIAIFRNILLPDTDYLIFNGLNANLTVRGNVQLESQ